MIPRSRSDHCRDVELAPHDDPAPEPAVAVVLDPIQLNRRVQALVEEHLDFVWRSLRSLGVPRADCDDGCQQVWWVVARKAQAIEAGKERSFIFSVVLRVASELRRGALRRNSVELDPEWPSPTPPTDELCDRLRAQGLLEALLSSLTWEQRVVFVMFELEGLSSVDIAEALSLPRGTVASRLRLAREAFNRALARHQAQSLRPVVPPPSAAPVGSVEVFE